MCYITTTALNMWNGGHWSLVTKKNLTFMYTSVLTLSDTTTFTLDCVKDTFGYCFLFMTYEDILCVSVIIYALCMLYL